jgi:hypothetical protein
MRPSRVIAALLFAAAIGTPALLAVPAWAASPTPPVAVHASPNPVLAGHTVTVSGSVGPDQAGSECATGVKLLSRAFNSNQDFAGVPALGATVRPDGTFTATTTIPRSRAAGSYTITGRCGGGNLGVSATLVVRAPASPTTTPTQPATPAAAHLASRWIIPGLVALGSGTLAALGVWALYRRRHPPGSSRQGRSPMAH